MNITLTLNYNYRSHNTNEISANFQENRHLCGLETWYRASANTPTSGWVIYHLETLYDDLASAKGKHLTPTEKLHLRGLLCGHSPAEIAEKLNKQAGGVETDLSATIYRYVKALAGIDGEKIEGWRKVKELLEAAGYKVPTKPEIRGMILGESTVNISEIKFEKSDYAIGNLVTVFTLRLEIPTEKIVDSESQDQEPKI